MASELVYRTWERITGKPWSEAKKMGLTNGSASANLALQKKLLSGWNPVGGAAPAASAPAAAPAPVDSMEATRRWIADWYAVKPATPKPFTYAPEEEAAALRTSQETYRPFYQEQVTQSGDEYTKALANARAGFSRRGLWGAAGGTEQKIDPATGLAYTTATAPAITGGPVSGLRQVGEQKIGEAQERSSTAFGRAYTESVETGVKGTIAAREKAEDVYQKTIRQPYLDQLSESESEWERLQSSYLAGLK